MKQLLQMVQQSIVQLQRGKYNLESEKYNLYKIKPVSLGAIHKLNIFEGGGSKKSNICKLNLFCRRHFKV